MRIILATFHFIFRFSRLFYYHNSVLKWNFCVFWEEIANASAVIQHSIRAKQRATKKKRKYENILRKVWVINVQTLKLIPFLHVFHVPYNRNRRNGTYLHTHTHILGEKPLKCMQKPDEFALKLSYIQFYFYRMSGIHIRII